MLAPIIYMECTLQLLYEVDRHKLTHLKGQFVELKNGIKYLKTNPDETTETTS